MPLGIVLPAPDSNGAGPWVDTSGLDATKTITVGGLARATVNIEVSNDAVPYRGGVLVSFPGGGGTQGADVVSRWMRATVSGYKDGGAPIVQIGAHAGDTTFEAVPVPLGNGEGPGVDISDLGVLKTVVVAGRFRGNVTVQISGDGVSWAAAFSFDKPGVQSRQVVQKYMRAIRTGIPGTGAALTPPTVNVGGVPPAAGPDPSGLEVPNGDIITILPGMAISLIGDMGFAADAGVQGLAAAIGVASAGADLTMPIALATSGVLELETTQWDAVTGASGGLVPGARYFVGTFGSITTSRPTALGSSVTVLGEAASPTALVLSIGRPVLL